MSNGNLAGVPVDASHLKRVPKTPRGVLVIRTGCLSLLCTLGILTELYPNSCCVCATWPAKYFSAFIGVGLCLHPAIGPLWSRLIWIAALLVSALVRWSWVAVLLFATFADPGAKQHEINEMMERGHDNSETFHGADRWAWWRDENGHIFICYVRLGSDGSDRFQGFLFNADGVVPDEPGPFLASLECTRVTSSWSLATGRMQ